MKKHVLVYASILLVLLNSARPCAASEEKTTLIVATPGAVQQAWRHILGQTSPTNKGGSAALGSRLLPVAKLPTPAVPVVTSSALNPDRMVALDIPAQSSVNDPFAQATSLYYTGDFAGALSIFNQNEKLLESASVVARVNCAETQLALGDYAQGFKAREARLKLPNYTQHPNMLQPGDDVRGKNIAILHDPASGVGDDAFFGRFVLMLSRQGPASITLVSGKEAGGKLSLATLRSLGGCTRAIKPDAFKAEEYDKVAYMMSLPHIFGLNDPAKIPWAHEGYMWPQADGTLVNHEAIEQWTKFLHEKSGFNVGICWQSSSNPAGIAKKIDRGVGVEALVKQLSIPNVNLYDLQGPGHEPVKGVNIVSGLDASLPFADTIPLMYAMAKDNNGCIVSVDTSIANIAGAMGCRCFCLLTKNHDWRWGVRTKLYEKHGVIVAATPWYSSMTLLIATTDDMQPVLEELRSQLFLLLKIRSCYEPPRPELHD